MRTNPQEQTRLRSELKEWEKFFASTHHGRKASREDIKQCPDIGNAPRSWTIVRVANAIEDNKYKAYNKLRNTALKVSVITPSKKRLFPDAEPQIPDPHASKCLKQNHNIYSPTANLPIPIVVSPIQTRISIGPTPQKNGQVIGLFDRLATCSKSETPSKQALAAAHTRLTPSKLSSGHAEGPAQDIQAHSLSRGRQDVLHSLTPQTPRITKNCTPGSKSGVRKLRYDDTPAFLRRDSQRDPAKDGTGGDANDNSSWSPIVIRTVPKAAGRGLSALVKGLREMEDEALDDELDMLREMEGFGSPANRGKKNNAAKVLVQDSQTVGLPLGPDGQLTSEDEDSRNEGRERDGKLLKAWKKKGQKRTTRQVTMKPSTTKRKPEPSWVGDDDVDDKENTELVEQVLLLNRVSNRDAQEIEESDLCKMDNGIKEGATNDEGPQQEQRKKETKSTLLIKARKRISATAHPNFRALKIKNKQSKARGSGRFGRR